MRVLLYGAGGHARVVLDAARAQGMEVVGVIDDRADLRGVPFDGIPILGGEDAIARVRETVGGMILGVGSVEAPSPRAAFFERVSRHGLAFPVVRHPMATVAGSASIGDATVVFAAAVINPHATVGRNVIVNTAAVIEHDCIVGDHAHVSPGALLAGGVAVGRGSHVGIGAVIIQGVRVGEGVMIGAGAVVLEDLEDGARVAGVPARSIA